MAVGMGRQHATDRALVARLRAGELAAFEAIVARYRAALIARAQARLGSCADAEDVAQDAFVQAFLHRHALRNPEALLPWLRRITDRLALQRQRQREHPTPPDDLEVLADQHCARSAPDGALEIESLLAPLSAAMRETVSLTLLAGYTCAEAAEIMGVSEGTVKSRLHRARSALKEVWMTHGDMTGRGGADDFTRRTIARLKRQARRLVAEGKLEEASCLANEILREQITPLFGDPARLGIAQTLRRAYDNPAFQPDAEAVALRNLPWTERRRRDCAANAAQYGYRLEELDWTLEDVDMQNGTLGKPTGTGRDTWGVPVSRLALQIVDARALCQRLAVSPLRLYQWVQQGCPILRCWPFARFDVARVAQWLADQGIHDWPREPADALARPIRLLFRAVAAGELTPEQAETSMRTLGYGVWEAPMPDLTGGW